MSPAAVRKINGKWAAVEPGQNELADRLGSYDPRAKEAYLGALHALRQGDYPDQFVQAAHSLREVIDLLTKHKKPEGERMNRMDKKQRKACLQATIDPLSQQALGADDKYDSLVRLYGELSKTAHHGQASAEEVTKALSKMEEVLGVLTTPQLAVNEETDALLSRTPSTGRAMRLLETQFRGAAQFRLVEVMPDHWLPHMREAGFFSSPRPAKESQPYTKWPPSLYLRKCTERYGKDVAEIILACKFGSSQDRNPAVYIDFLECALGLPLPSAEKIARKALREAWGDFAHVSILDDKYMELASRLYKEGKRRVAAEMVYSALSTKLLGAAAAPGGGAADQGPGKIAMPPNLYWFEETLSKMVFPLAQKEPWPVIELLGRLLGESVLLEERRREEAEQGGDTGGTCDLLDPSPNACDYAWAEAHGHIVDCILNCIRGCVPGTPEGMERLRRILKTFYKKCHCDFRRLEMAVYAEFPDEFRREVETTLLIHFDRNCARDEYYRLLKASFGTLPQSMKEAVLKLVEEGHMLDSREVIGWWSGHDHAKAMKKRWKLRYLDLVKDHLWGEHAALHSALLAEFRKPDYPGRFPPKITFQEMPASGKHLAGKNASQVFAYMKDYQASVNEFYSGSTAGIEFEEYVESNPEECSSMATEAEPWGAAAQCCLLAGLDRALRAGKSISWDGAMRLIEHAVKAPQTRRRMTSSLACAACGLIERGLKKDLVDFGTMRHRVWNVLEALVEIGTENAESGGHAGQENSLNVSLNGINGLSFHAVYQYAVWCERNGGERRVFVPEAKRVFDDYLDKKMLGHTAARHAVLGAFFPNFYYLDRKWVETLLSKIRSGKKTIVSFWEGYVSWNDVYSYAFKDMLPLYREFFGKKLVRDTANNRPYESTVVHVMLAYFYGLEGADGLVKEMLARKDDGAIKVCAQQIGVIVKGKEGDGEFDKERLVGLWKDNSFKRFDLTMWFVNSPLDKRRSISLYRDYIAGHQGAPSPLYASLGILDKYARDFPAEVAECLYMLLDKPGSCDPDSVHGVLKQVIDTGNRQAVEKCRAVIEKAAQMGHEWRGLL